MATLVLLNQTMVIKTSDQVLGLLTVTEHGRMIAVGDLIKIDAREVDQTVTMIINVLIVQDGTMAFTIAGKGKTREGDSLATNILTPIVRVVAQKLVAKVLLNNKLQQKIFNWSL